MLNGNEIRKSRWFNTLRYI